MWDSCFPASRPSARSLLMIMIRMHSVKDKCIIWIVCHAKASCHSSESNCHLNYDCFPCSIRLYLLKMVKTRRNDLFPPFLAQVKQGLLVLPVPSKIIIKSLCLFFSFFSPSSISQEQKVDYYAVSRSSGGSFCWPHRLSGGGDGGSRCVGFLSS